MKTVIYITVGVAFILFAFICFLSQLSSCRGGLGSRAEAEIVALSAALESYREDHGRYPSNTDTELLSPVHNSDPTDYVRASQFLYRALSGDANGDPNTSGTEDQKVYFTFKRDWLRTAPGGSYIVDPWENAYGYSTLKAKQPNSPAGYNGTFDLWSTGGKTQAKDQRHWYRNWESSYRF